jgi:hypothetical protein
MELDQNICYNYNPTYPCRASLVHSSDKSESRIYYAYMIDSYRESALLNDSVISIYGMTTKAISLVIKKRRRNKLNLTTTLKKTLF